MDRLEDDLRSRNTTLYSDTSDAVRLPHQPMHGKGFVGPTSTFGRAAQSKTNSLRTKRPGKPSAQRPPDALASGDEPSDDELLLSSQDSKTQEKSAGRTSRARTRKEERDVHTDTTVYVDGVRCEYHPNYPPGKKLPNFKKKDSSAAAGSVSPSGYPSSQGSVSSTKAIVGRATTPRSPPRHRTGSPDQTSATTSKLARKLRDRFPPLNQLNPNDSQEPSDIVDIDPDQDPEHSLKTPRPSTSRRPKPKPAYKGVSRSKQEDDVIDIPSEETEGKGDVRRSRRRKPVVQRSDSEDENQSRRRAPVEKAKHKGKGKAKEPMNPIDSLSPVHHSSDEDTPQRPTEGKARKKTRKLAEFPAPPPLSNPSSPRRAKKSKQPDDFPMDVVSPLSSQKSQLSRQASQLREFPELPPLSSSPEDDGSRARNGKTKSSSQKSRVHKGAVLSSDEDADLRPFPMQTQLLESIGRSPPKRLDGHSSDLEDERARRARKKRRADADPNERYELSYSPVRLGAQLYQHMYASHRLADILRDGDGPEFDDDDMGEPEVTPIVCMAG